MLLVLLTGRQISPSRQSLPLHFCLNCQLLSPIWEKHLLQSFRLRTRYPGDKKIEEIGVLSVSPFHFHRCHDPEDNSFVRWKEVLQPERNRRSCKLKVDNWRVLQLRLKFAILKKRVKKRDERITWNSHGIQLYIHWYQFRKCCFHWERCLRSAFGSNKQKHKNEDSVCLTGLLQHVTCIHSNFREQQVDCWCKVGWRQRFVEQPLSGKKQRVEDQQST